MCMKDFNIQKIIFWQIYSILNLTNFRPMHILDNG